MTVIDIEVARTQRTEACPSPAFLRDILDNARADTDRIHCDGEAQFVINGRKMYIEYAIVASTKQGWHYSLIRATPLSDHEVLPEAPVWARFALLRLHPSRPEIRPLSVDEFYNSLLQSRDDLYDPVEGAPCSLGGALMRCLYLIAPS